MTSHRNSCAVAVVELAGPDASDTLVAAMAERAAHGSVPLRVAYRAGPEETVPERRRRALENAGADIVLMVEDTSVPDDSWLEGLEGAFAQDEVAMAWGPVAVDPILPARFRALGRLEYGRFDGRRASSVAPGNLVAMRRGAALAALAPGEGLIEHELARRLLERGLKVVMEPSLRSVYSRPDRHGARFATRFRHGRIFGAGRAGGRIDGALRAALATPVLSLRAFRAAIAAGPLGLWLPELPWIVLMAAAWSAGELTGQLFGAGRSAGSWT